MLISAIKVRINTEKHPEGTERGALGIERKSFIQIIRAWHRGTISETEEGEGEEGGE